MTDPAEQTRDDRLADLAALKAASLRRYALPPGSPEWQAALQDEQAAIERVRQWSHSTPDRTTEQR